MLPIFLLVFINCPFSPVLCGRDFLYHFYSRDSQQQLLAWHGMAWHGMAWHGMAWHGIAAARTHDCFDLETLTTHDQRRVVERAKQACECIVEPGQLACYRTSNIRIQI